MLNCLISVTPISLYGLLAAYNKTLNYEIIFSYLSNTNEIRIVALALPLSTADNSYYVVIQNYAPQDY